MSIRKNIGSMASENLKNNDLDKQIESYEETHSILSFEDKILLAKEILLNHFTSCKRLNLVSDLIYDTASDSQDYIELLDLAASKFNLDRSHWALFEPLIRVGREKWDVADAIRKRVLETDTNEHERLVIVSGLLLGGMYENNPDELLKIIEEHLECNNPAVLQADMLALRIVCRPMVAISSNIQSIFETLVSRNIQSVNLEAIQFLLDNYEKNPDYFYDLLVSLVRIGNVAYADAIFFRLESINPLHENHFFDLLEVVKKYDDERHLGYISQCLLNYPTKADEIVDILYKWLQSGKIWSIPNFHIIIEKITKGKPSAIHRFIQRYCEECCRKGYATEPVLFEYFLNVNLGAALEAVLPLPIDDKLHTDMKIYLYQEIIRHCYDKQEYLPQIRLLGPKLLKECLKLPYVPCEINQGLLNSEKLSKDQYNELVNSIFNSLESILNTKESYDFDQIFTNLKYYPTIQKYANSTLKECERLRTYSPLLYLLDYKICEAPGPWDENPAWSLAYLSELEEGLRVFEKTTNLKCKTGKDKQKFVEDRLKADTHFWSFFTELIVMNRIGLDNIVAKDFGLLEGGDLDLKANLFGKTFYFEVTSPEMPRKVKISNQAVFMKGKTYSAIDDKRKQVITSGVYSEIDRSEGSYYYIIINGTQLPLLSIDISTAIMGPLCAQYKTCETTEKQGVVSIGRSVEKTVFLRNDKYKYVSGVICFTWGLSKTPHLPPRIELKGGVINNPYAKNRLTKEETEQLNGVFFKSHDI